MKKTILNTSFKLAVFGMVATGLVGLTHFLTRDIIAEQKHQTRVEQLQQIIPKKMHNNDLFEHCTLISAPEYLGSNEKLPVYIAKKSGYTTGVAMEVVANGGYNGDIRLLVGFSRSGTITGVRVLEHNETPGLGNKIEIGVSSWIDSFTGKKLNLNPEPRPDGFTSATDLARSSSPNSIPKEFWRVRKDGGAFDAFTGATVTPRAIVKATCKAAEYYQQINRTIGNSPLNCYDSSDTTTAKS